MSKRKPKPDEDMMTVAEAIRHIMRVERCSEQEAGRQLMAALARGRMPAFVQTPVGPRPLPREAFLRPAGKAH